MESRRRKLPRAGTRFSIIDVPLVHITCDAKPLIASRSFTMQSSERPAAIHLLLLFKSQAAQIQTLFSNRREGDSPKLLDPTQPNPLVAQRG